MQILNGLNVSNSTCDMFKSNELIFRIVRQRVTLTVENYAEISAFTTLTFHIYATQHSTPTTHETC